MDTDAVIVVCEDDDATRELLCDHLAADRFEAIPAPLGADALRECRFSSPEVLLLDLQLPDRSGLDVLRELRAGDRVTSPYDPNLGIIVVSGRNSERDRVRGLEAGADDYLPKPFGYGELLARIGAVMRRRTGSPRVMRIEGLVIDRKKREVMVDGERLHLSAKEFGMVSLLASEPTRVFSKQELLTEVWGTHSAGCSRTLESHASRLRRKLDPDGGRFVVNCWGVGYKLVGP